MFAALVFVAAAAAATLIPAPDDWRKESFPFPLQFAPGIPYQGMEYLRFHPGWDQFADETGFSYVVLWDVKAVPVEPPDIEDHLETYFNGLMSNVARGRKLGGRPERGAGASDWRRCPIGNRGSACRSAPTTRSRRASRLLPLRGNHAAQGAGAHADLLRAVEVAPRQADLELASQSQGSHHASPQPEILSRSSLPPRAAHSRRRSTIRASPSPRRSRR
jgi:hypothetical protein